MTVDAQWTIRFYKDRDGCEPVSDWLDGLPSQERAKIERFLRLLCELGTKMPGEHARHLTGHGPLWELRPHPNRLLYVAHTGRQFIVLHGFRKKGQKTPRKHIERALSRWADFVERERNGEP